MTAPHFTPEITDDFVKMHEDYFEPTIYAQWAHRVAEIAEIDLGTIYLMSLAGRAHWHVQPYWKLV